MQYNDDLNEAFNNDAFVKYLNMIYYKDYYIQMILKTKKPLQSQLADVCQSTIDNTKLKQPSALC